MLHVTVIELTKKIKVVTPGRQKSRSKRHTQASGSNQVTQITKL